MGNQTFLRVVPLYIQVKEELTSRILRGGWKPGDAIPNEMEIAKEYSVSIGTVRKALDLMESERLVVRRQGRGTFVRDQSEEIGALSNIRDASGHALPGVKETLSQLIVKADRMVATKLGIEEGSEVIKLERVRRYRSEPYMFETSYLSKRLFSKLPDNFPDFEISALAQFNAMLCSSAEEMVTVTTADDSSSSVLSVAVGEPLMALERLVFSERRVALEWCLAKCALRHVNYYALYN